MLNMQVLDYRITSDSNQVIVTKVRRNDAGEISMITNKAKAEAVATLVDGEVEEV